MTTGAATASRQYKCDYCRDRGFTVVYKIPEWAPTYPTPVRFMPDCPYCSGGLEARAEAILKRSDIPLAFRRCTMADFDWKIYRHSPAQMEDTRVRQDYVNDFLGNFPAWRSRGKGFYIWSNAKGSGKTMLASCMCNELIARYGIITKFVSSGRLLDMASSDSRRETDYIDTLCECGLLVLDDLGQKRANDWMNDLLFRIMDERMQRKLVTIVTSNVSLKKLQMDERVLDRLYSSCFTLHIPDNFIRSQKNNAEMADFLADRGLLRQEPEDAPWKK